MADEQYNYDFKPSLYDYDNFDSGKDAETLRGAMKGLGTDEKVIIGIVAGRTLRQRLEIEKAYHQKFGRDLKEDLKKELMGDFEDTVVAMFYSEYERDARFLYKAMCGPATDEECLIEILASRSNYKLKRIMETYQEKYGKGLEAAVKDDTSGHFRTFLCMLLQANRSEAFTVDKPLAKKEAKILFEAGEKFWGTNEEAFNLIFCTRSFPQLRATFREYEKLAGKSIKKAIGKEFSGDMEDGLLAIVEIADYIPLYFARRLHHAMDGPATDDSMLIRIVVTRCEYDMSDIKSEFKKLYKKSLYSWIKDDTSGDYRRMLLALVGE